MQQEHLRKPLTTKLIKTQFYLLTFRFFFQDELKATKRRLEAFESSNASYVATIKALQQERDELDKQIGVQEVEIERLLKIVQRLHEMYDSAKVPREPRFSGLTR